MNANQYRLLFESFKNKSVLIIGDMMVDAYIWGKVDRISPEAPVPVVRVGRRDSRLGGAANVALNIKSLGAEAILLSVTGDDARGKELLALMDEASLPADGILLSQKRITTTKFRIIGNNTQMLRVDEEIDEPLSPEDKSALIALFDTILQQRKIDAIVFQDYDKGVIDPSLIDHVVKHARQKSIPVAVDPKKRNFFAYQGVSLFKPNLKELKEGLKADETPEGDQLEVAVRQLQESLHADAVMVTRSEKGVYIQQRDATGETTSFHIPAIIRHIADVSGAGDTVISVATLCLACGLDGYEMASVANRAGGLVCEMVGVVPVDREALLSELMRDEQGN